MFMNEFNIGDVKIGTTSPAYFIAEIGSNFDGDLSRAKDLIYKAKEAGAHAAKFQHYTADTLVSDFGFKALGDQLGHQKKWVGSVFDTYKRASLDKDWTAELAETCDKAGIHFMTSPYSIELVDYVNKYVPAFKIGSGDITWPDIIDAIARKGKPVLLATGASTLNEVVWAMKTIQKSNDLVVLMQCNTNYIADVGNFTYQNIRVLELYKLLFPNVALGLSDHTKGHTSILGAYTLGARIFEKHFTDDTSRLGPDHEFATNPNEFRAMVDKTLELETLLGQPCKDVEQNEIETRLVQRRSIHASRDIDPGETLLSSDFHYLRPCPPDSIPPYLAGSIVGKKSKVTLVKGQTIKLSDIE